MPAARLLENCRARCWLLAALPWRAATYDDLAAGVNAYAGAISICARPLAACALAPLPTRLPLTKPSAVFGGRRCRLAARATGAGARRVLGVGARGDLCRCDIFAAAFCSALALAARGPAFTCRKEGVRAC